MVCDKCGYEMQVGDFPFCPHPRGANAAIGDDIPGGMEIHHGLCNPDGSPRRYYSHSDMAREAKKRGLVNRVEHVPMRGSNRSPHTTRWI